MRGGKKKSIRIRLIFLNETTLGYVGVKFTLEVKRFQASLSMHP